MKIVTLTTGTGVVTTKDLNYVPQYIAFAAATQLTGFKCEVLGEGVICDLDANGLTALGRHRLAGYPTNGYVIPLADGKIINKNVTLTFTNSAAQTPDVYAGGMRVGSNYIRTTRAKVFASQLATFDKFGALFLPSLAAGDKVIIKWVDGLIENHEREDLAYISGYTQYATGFVVDNVEGMIDEVSVLAASDQSIYITRYTSDLENSLNV